MGLLLFYYRNPFILHLFKFLMMHKYTIKKVSPSEYGELKRCEAGILDSIRSRLLSISGIDSGGIKAEINYIPKTRTIHFSVISDYSTGTARKISEPDFLNCYYCNISERLESLRLLK